MKRALKAMAACGLVVAVAGTLVEITAKDRWLATAVLYYATPWLLRGLAGLAACILWWRFRPIRWIALIVAISALVQGAISFRFHPATGPYPAGTVTAAVWNTGHVFRTDRTLWPAAGETDVCAVLETGRFTEDEWAAFCTTNPGESWRRLEGGVALGVKGDILNCEPLHHPKDPFRAFHATVRLPGRGQFCVIVVDVRSEPWFSREPVFAAIRAAAGDDPRCIILGDFNTPCESLWLEKWKSSGLSLANDGPGRGVRETWPYGVPLWTLDQAWTGSGWNCLKVAHRRFGSDHAKVLVTLAATKPNEEEPTSSVPRASSPPPAS